MPRTQNIDFDYCHCILLGLDTKRAFLLKSFWSSFWPIVYIGWLQERMFALELDGWAFGYIECFMVRHCEREVWKVAVLGRASFLLRPFLTCGN